MERPELFAELRQSVLLRPDVSAILAPGRLPLSFAQLRNHMEYVAGVVADSSRGLTTVILPEGPELMTALLGAMVTGAVAPLNPSLTEEEMRRQLISLRPGCAIVDAEAREYVLALLDSFAIRAWRTVWEPGRPAGLFTLQAISDRRAAQGSTGGSRVIRSGAELPANARLLLQTSGTTDRPKIAPLTDANLRTAFENQVQCFGLTDRDRLLCLSPLFHLHGLAAAGAQLTAGGSVICTRGFDPRAFPEWLGEFRPTWYTGGPALHRAVASVAANGALPCPSLRFVRSSSAAPESELQSLIETALGVPFLDSYGLTEASTIAANPLPPRLRKPGSCGVSVGPEIAIRDLDGRPLPPGEAGEVTFRGANVIAGYLDDAATNRDTFRDGWMYTGDLGHLDDEGYLFITGRLKDVINRGGAKIMPSEVDAVLLAHPGVAAAAAFGVPHPRLGEEVEAAVVLHHSGAATEHQLRTYAAERLVPFKVPQRIHFTEGIPTTSTGKPRRSELAGRFVRIPAASPAKGSSLTSDESRVGAIWTRVLGCTDVAAEDDFFALGGDSLSAAIILAETQKEFGIAGSLFAFFEQPTVAHLARLAASDAAKFARSNAIHVSGTGARTPIFAIPAIGNDPYYLRHLAARIDAGRPFFALPTTSQPGEIHSSGIEGLARQAVIDLRAVRSRGPYILAGYCSGGVVAFEAASQMRRDGDEIELVILIDTPTPGYPKAARHWKGYAPAAWTLLREHGAFELMREAVRHVRAVTQSRHRELDWSDKDSAASGALQDHAPRRLDVPVVQVLATGQPVSTRVFEDHRLGWRDFTPRGFTVVQAPGNHQTVLAPPHIDEAARSLRGILNPASA